MGGTQDDQWIDEEPPLLGGEDEDEKQQQAEISIPPARTNNQDEAAASIMDEMVAVATQAKAAKRQQQERERRSSIGFGAGLKKGFFASASSAKPKKQPSKPRRLDVSQHPAKRREESLRIVNTNQTSDAKAENTPSFVFPEVQDALQSMNQLTPNDWMNEKFFAKMAQNPKLLQALQNPRFTEAINELQKDPQAAVLKYQRDPDVSVMLRDFMEFLGSHFEELGKEQEKMQQPLASAPAPAPPAPLAPHAPPIVDLDKTRRQAIANMKRSPEEEEYVQRILQNPELLAALSDARLMEQLRQSQQDPQTFQRLAHDPVLGPKLRLLIDAKMVALA